MELNHQIAVAAAQRFFGTPAPPKRIGWGVSGFVYLSPDLRTVVKVFRQKEGFNRELEVYGRLRALRITQLHGLAIPKVRAYRADDNLIQMDFVVAPFLVDFAGVLLSPPDFTEDVMNDWHAKNEFYFGPNVGIAYAVYHSLKQHGMYYMDLRPSNLKLDGLPGLEPYPSPEFDEP